MEKEAKERIARALAAAEAAEADAKRTARSAPPKHVPLPAGALSLAAPLAAPLERRPCGNAVQAAEQAALAERATADASREMEAAAARVAAAVAEAVAATAAAEAEAALRCEAAAAAVRSAEEAAAVKVAEAQRALDDALQAGAPPGFLQTLSARGVPAACFVHQAPWGALCCSRDAHGVPNEMAFKWRANGTAPPCGMQSGCERTPRLPRLR